MTTGTYQHLLTGDNVTQALAERIETARRTPTVRCQSCLPTQACSQHLAAQLVEAVRAEDLVIMPRAEADAIIREAVRRLTANASPVSSSPEANLVTIVGRLSDVKKHTTRQNLPWATVNLTSGDQTARVLVYPTAYESCRAAIRDGATVMLIGRRVRGGYGGDLIADIIRENEACREAHDDPAGCHMQGHPHLGPCISNPDAAPKPSVDHQCGPGCGSGSTPGHPFHCGCKECWS